MGYKWPGGTHGAFLFFAFESKTLFNRQESEELSLLASLDLSTQKHPLLFEATAHWAPGLCLGPGLQHPHGVVTTLLHCSAGGDGKEQGSFSSTVLSLWSS